MKFRTTYNYTFVILIVKSNKFLYKQIYIIIPIIINIDLIIFNVKCRKKKLQFVQIMF